MDKKHCKYIIRVSASTLDPLEMRLCPNLVGFHQSLVLQQVNHLRETDSPCLLCTAVATGYCSPGLRLSLPQGIFRLWPELMIRVNKKNKAFFVNIYFLAIFNNWKYKLKMLLDVLMTFAQAFVRRLRRKYLLDALSAHNASSGFCITTKNKLHI